MIKKFLIMAFSLIITVGAVAQNFDSEQALSTEDVHLDVKYINTEILGLLQQVYQGNPPKILMQMIQSERGYEILRRMYLLRKLDNVSPDLPVLRRFFDDMTLLCEFLMIMDPIYRDTTNEVQNYFVKLAEFLQIDENNLDETVPAVQFYLHSKRDVAARAALHAQVDQLNRDCIILQDRLFSCATEFERQRTVCTHDNDMLRAIISNLNDSLDSVRVELQEKYAVNDALLNKVDVLNKEIADLKKVVEEKVNVQEQKKLYKMELDCVSEQATCVDVQTIVQESQSVIRALHQQLNQKSTTIRQLVDRVASVTRCRNWVFAFSCAAVSLCVGYHIYH